MRSICRCFWYFVLTVAVLGCKKPYNPTIVATNNNYLVVEGTINTGSDSTIFRLSRTVNVSSTVTINPEKGATVTIESNANGAYPLTETKSGYYTSPGLNLDNSKQYRLRILTANNQQYLSDFVAVKITPPIDSVGYAIQSNGLQLYVNTHDPQNNTRYYRWDYVETWQFHAKYESSFISNGKEIVPRTVSQFIYSCFGNAVSSNIVLGSSAKLKQDVIYQSPLTAIASTSEKIETKYSILVRQYALTSDAYNFWVNLKTNTEDLGSIFDAQPSQAPTNIHNISNPTAPAIGYISACLVQTKRIFISNTQLPNWQPTYPYTCELDSIWYSAPKSGFNEVAAELVPLPNSEIPVTSFYLKGSPAVAGFLSSDIDCVDCTIRGTQVQPSFWK